MKLGIIVNLDSDNTSIKNWAIVQNNIVENIIVATGEFLSTQTNSFDYAVSDSPSAATGFAYDPGSNIFSPVVTAITLAQAKALNIADFQVAAKAFVDSLYSIDVRVNFIGIYLNAQANLLINRQAYIAPLIVWQNAVIVYCSSYIMSVNAMTDISTVQSTKPNFSALIASDPHLSPIAALQIIT